MRLEGCRKKRNAGGRESQVLPYILSSRVKHRGDRKKGILTKKRGRYSRVTKYVLLHAIPIYIQES